MNFLLIWNTISDQAHAYLVTAEAPVSEDWGQLSTVEAYS